MLEENTNSNQLLQRPYLAAVQLLNCQSHENTVYEFAADKINIIKAPNNTGKSVLFKMLAITVDPKSIPVEKRKQLISYGAQSARVGYIFSDDTMGYCEVWPSQVIYYWKDAGEEQFVASYEPPDELLWRLSVLADPKEHSIANLIDNDQNLLLVDSDEKSNHKLLKIVTENERLNSLKEIIDKKYADYTHCSSDLNSKLRLIECQMESLSKIDVNQLKQKIRESEALNDVLYTLVDALGEIQIIAGSQTRKKDYNLFLRLASTLVTLASIRNTLGSIQISKRVGKETIQLTDVIATISKVLHSMQKITSIDEEKLQNVIKLLLAVEALNPSNLIPQKKDFRWKSKSLTVIEELNEVLKQIKEVVVQDDEVLKALVTLHPVQQIVGINRLVQEVAQTKTANNGLSKSIAEYTNILQENNAIVECGVYGKAIFDGKECSPFGA